MYNFDKDYEDDRELLREDPYAEYPDFPKECRMTDMAQIDMYIVKPYKRKIIWHLKSKDSNEYSR